MFGTCESSENRGRNARTALVSAGLMLGTALILTGIKASVMYISEGSLAGDWHGFLDKVWIPVMMVGTIPSVSTSRPCGSCLLSRIFRRGGSPEIPL